MSAETSALARCDTGTIGLDHILRGGFPPSVLYLLQGDPGVGKTTLAMQFLSNCKMLGLRPKLLIGRRTSF
ncbi:MAG TPA: ATPase domain-containing protein [Chthoniobacterales bacterium]|nr:ATPase domain-containing protein [Chthoniobacterales bacterium]